MVSVAKGAAGGNGAAGYHDVLAGLVAELGTINILQVGANDGRLGDPLYGFVKKHRKQTRIVLVEPQPDLIPELEGNYAFHPDKVICQMAVGPEGVLRLYRVRKACWPDLVVPYGTGWPAYRAPTGVTSARRDNVLDWLKRFYKGPEPLESVVEAFDVDALPTRDLLAKAALFDRPDVIQIDAEGFDAEVIRVSDIPTLRPRVIFFEAMNLSPDVYGALSRDLESWGYTVERQRKDAIARLQR